MYTLFQLPGSRAARCTAAAGSLITTIILMASAVLPASPAAPFPMGGLA